MGSTWKKPVAASLAGVLALGGLAACGNDSGSGGDDDVVTLSYWKSADTGRPDFEAFMEVVNKFNDEHEDIQLDVNTTPNDDYRTRLNTRAAGGDLPDVFQVWPGAELRPLVEAGAVEPIDDIEDYWLDSGLLEEGSFDEFTIEDNTYAVPVNSNPTHFIYYNKDMLSKAGYDSFPEDYDGFLQLIEDLKDEEVTPISLGNSGGWVLQSVYISTIADRFTGPDFLEDVENGDRKFTDPEFIQGLEVIEELNNMEAFNNDLNTIDSMQMIDQFLQEESAMVMDGNWAATEIIENKQEDQDIGITTIPLGDRNSISNTMGSASAINSDISDEKKEAAKEFLKWLYNEELFKELQSVGRIVPTNVENPNDELDPLINEMMEITQEAENAPVYDATLTPSLNDELENQLQALTLGEATPEEIGEALQKEVE
ncbi:ABC transporter substrate-binding protein [Marinococcus sp. PL1-022]|jgi:raffinose/stachyose/melibiose transport system substrate-binding protein|uniref:ABC transporter substrate-binding protein n=1 Tax=Marinococcus sp. PL1-022 TaxID=3095363 RepID=UPI002612CE01|nr:extracellular solute-binding protein [Marinococcus sp. PL1-022]MDX6154383.1 extracellular solute-binding protein [Marinococcus sp. PL1-022]